MPLSQALGTVGWFIRAADSLSELSVFLALPSASLSFAFESLARAKNVRPHSGLSPLPFDKQPNTDYEESVDLFGPQPATQILWLALQLFRRGLILAAWALAGWKTHPV